MSDNGHHRAQRVDLLALDHFPSCPRCGNLCGKLARVCADCGTRLYEYEDAAPKGEAAQPTEGTEA